MKDESMTDASLRQFLLGKLKGGELERIESLFLTDSVMRERVLAVEQDLVEDYLEDSLSSEDRERFVLRYAQSAEQKQKLRITRSIKDWAIAEDASRSATTREAGRSGPSSLWSRLFERLRLRPRLVVPIAAVVVLAVVFALIWFNRWNEQRRRFAIEQEVARLNSPAGLREFPPQTPVLRLSPLMLRGAPQGPSEVKLGTGVSFVELGLVWLQSEQYPSYQAVVRRYDGEELFTIAGLHAEEDGKTIRLRLSTGHLKPGLYIIRLTGVGTDGAVSPVTEYQFTVTE